MRNETVVDKALESRNAPYAMAAFLVVFPIVLIVWGIPQFGKSFGHRLPNVVLNAFEREAMEAIESQSRPSELPKETQARIQAIFDGLKVKAGVPHAKLVLRNSPMINAFTLSAGTVVVFDALVKKLNNDDALAAVLAHELGHAAKYHLPQKLISWGAVRSIIIPLVSQDRAGGKVASAMSQTMLESGYSRDLEREADAFAHALLAQTGRDPRLLGRALESMQTTRAGARKSYLSTHPATTERAATAEAAGEKFRANETIAFPK